MFISFHFEVCGRGKGGLGGGGRRAFTIEKSAVKIFECTVYFIVIWCRCFVKGHRAWRSVGLNSTDGVVLCS